MTPAMAELINRHRRTIASLEDQVQLMELGLAGRGGFTIHTNGRDATAEAIARAQAQISSLQILVDKHDPEGFTKIV